jgi:hypothetical protein
LYDVGWHQPLLPGADVGRERQDVEVRLRRQRLDRVEQLRLHDREAATVAVALELVDLGDEVVHRTGDVDDEQDVRRRRRDVGELLALVLLAVEGVGLLAALGLLGEFLIGRDAPALDRSELVPLLLPAFGVDAEVEAGDAEQRVRALGAHAPLLAHQVDQRLHRLLRPDLSARSDGGRLDLPLGGADQRRGGLAVLDPLQRADRVERRDAHLRLLVAEQRAEQSRGAGVADRL